VLRSCDGRTDAILGSASGIHSLLETCRDHRSPARASNSPNSVSAMITALGEKHLRTIWKQCYRSIDQTLCRLCMDSVKCSRSILHGKCRSTSITSRACLNLTLESTSFDSYIGLQALTRMIISRIYRRVSNIFSIRVSIVAMKGEELRMEFAGPTDPE